MGTTTLARPTTLTLAEAKHLAAEVVAEVGEDFVYQKPPLAGRCKYVHDDGPGCFVARILVKAGVPLTALARQEGSGAHVVLSSLNNDRLITVPWAEMLPLSEWAIDLQRQQDSGTPYGRALETANSHY